MQNIFIFLRWTIYTFLWCIKTSQHPYIYFCGSLVLQNILKIDLWFSVSIVVKYNIFGKK